ncbi:hypothetical protein [Verrucomicrobium spinosum]|uniref:hypothetical protein n=2 Tax=Verrucomicrobium spinosum TaxID=2736 RepID=UPI000AF1B391|nr:hypothetical protein [Verrucomicrobium spinosum]
MKMKIGGAALASAGAGLLLLVWQFGPLAKSNQAGSGGKPVSKNVGPGQVSKLAEAGNHPVIPRPLPFPSVKTTDPVIETTSRLGSPDAGIEDDIGILEVLLESYRRSLGSVPTGMNDQVVAALQGGNLRGLVVFPSQHVALSPKGELLDRWGTPYWFHAQSSKQMTVISAGPDKQFGTPDDVAPLGHGGVGDVAHEE